MTRPHDPTGAGGLREFRYSAWVHSRGNREDGSLGPGVRREADQVLEFKCSRLRIVREAGRTVIIDEQGCPVPILEYLEAAYERGKEISGVLIAADPDP